MFKSSRKRVLIFEIPKIFDFGLNILRGYSGVLKFDFEGEIQSSLLENYWNDFFSEVIGCVVVCSLNTPKQLNESSWN